MPPKGPVAAANKNNQNPKGLLQVNPAAINKDSTSPSKSTLRLKLLVRRLPPGLTKDEFLEALGDEWKPKAGKVDWFEYRCGKTRGMGKVSEQSRAYVHLVTESHIKSFESTFLAIASANGFQDAKGTHKDPNLKHLPPFLQFAPNQRVPAAKQRVDGRQGTIDQDAEFIEFLERETQPVTKPPSLEALAAEKAPQEKVTSTPLLDDLREKKANKAKSASSKPAKNSRPDAKEDKADHKSTSRRGGDVDQKPVKGGSKSTQATKEAVKVANKQAAKSAAAPANPSASASKSDQQPPASSASARKQRDRVTPNAIKSMLQRDLGLAPATGKRASKPAAAISASDAASTTSQPRSSTPSVVDAAPSPKSDATPKAAKPPRNRKGNAAEKTNGQTPTQDATKPAPPAPSAILKKTPPAPSTTKGGKGKGNAQNGTSQSAAVPSPSQSPAPSKSTKPPPQPSAGATKAYLKHANASQGITEPLILAALSPLGEIVKVDIDKRKGTAIAEFKNHDGLKAAMTKRSIPVAQGAVEVLEFRERPAQGGGRATNTPAATNTRGGGSVRGKGRAGRGATANANANSATPAPPAPAPLAAATGPADAT